MGSILKAVIAAATMIVYVWLLCHGLYEQHLYFVIASLIVIGIAYIIYKN